MRLCPVPIRSSNQQPHQPMEESVDQRRGNRAARRRAMKEYRRGQRSLQTAVAAGAVVALGAGLLGGAGAAHADEGDLLGGLGDLGAITGLLENEMVKDFIEVCQNPDGSTPVIDAENPPVAVADCSQSTGGMGVAVVLPDSIEIGGLMESQKVDLGEIKLGGGFGSINLGEKNMIQLLSGLALGSDTTKSIANGLGYGRIDPFAVGNYSSYDQIREHANLDRVYEDSRKWECDYGTTANVFGVKNHEVSDPGDTCPTKTYKDLFGKTKTATGKVKLKSGEVTEDKHYDKRRDALKMVEYLTGEKFDSYNHPVELPALADLGPKGGATVKGDGLKVALAMRGGNATAEANTLFGLPGVALAGADHGRTSTATSQLGVATALNMDTDQIKLTWFGKELDFTNLKKSGALDLAGEEGAALVDQIEGLQLPGLKEVSCYGIQASAVAEGLGSCSNYLGTFDFYQDLREVTLADPDNPGGNTPVSRQTQYGLTDLSSLVFGNDALLKQFGMLGGSETTPFMDTLMDNLTSEDGRLKFAKDFVRFTQDVQTRYVLETVLDDDGNPVLDPETGQPKTRVKMEEVKTPIVDGAGEAVLDDDGNPTYTTSLQPVTDTITAAYLTSDYGLREPITIEWLGHTVVLFPAATVNGADRPNYLSLPQIKKIAADADRGLLPKIGVITVDNPFGFGTLTSPSNFDFLGMFRDYRKTVTIDDDLKQIGSLIEQSTGGVEGLTASVTGAAAKAGQKAKDGLADLRSNLTSSTQDGTQDPDPTPVTEPAAGPEQSSPEGDPTTDLSLNQDTVSEETVEEDGVTGAPVSVPPASPTGSGPAGIQSQSNEGAVLVQ